MTAPQPAPQIDFRLDLIPAALRAEAARLDDERQAEWTAYMGPARRFTHLPAVMALECRARELLREVSELLVGEEDALDETREVLGEGVSAVEAIDVIANYPDAHGVPAWLAAAAAWAAEVQS